MKTSEVLHQTWSAILAEQVYAEGFYHRRIPLPAHWPAHAGIRYPQKSRLLILEVEKQAIRATRLKDETKGYSIDIVPDAGNRAGRVSILILETSGAYKEIFSIFCSDVLSHWCPHTEIADAIKALEQRLGCWRTFFQRGSPSGLGRDEYIGLYGELSYIESGLLSGVPAPIMVQSWKAPKGSNQDFLFGTIAVEVKTTTGNDIDTVTISNARQLDRTGLQRLLLIRFAFDFREGSGETLPQLVSRLKERLSTVSIEAFNSFCDRLLEAGFIENNHNHHAAWGFTRRNVATYDVIDGFPSLVESQLQPGISDVSYSLNLCAAEVYRISENAFCPKVLVSYV